MNKKQINEEKFKELTKDIKELLLIELNYRNIQANGMLDSMCFEFTNRKALIRRISIRYKTGKRARRFFTFISKRVSLAFIKIAHEMVGITGHSGTLITVKTEDINEEGLDHANFLLINKYEVPTTYGWYHIQYMQEPYINSEKLVMIGLNEEFCRNAFLKNRSAAIRILSINLSQALN